MSHCIASPSSSERWLQCSGSLLLIQRLQPPPVYSPAMEQGTRLHNVASEFFTTENPLALAEHYKASGQDAEYSMYEYYKYVRGIQQGLGTEGGAPALQIESKISLESIMDGMFGTPDAVVYNNQALHVIDLKTGRIPVPPVENSQLMLYAYGAIKTYNLNPSNITLHIYQKHPEGVGNVQTYSFKPLHLQNFIECVQSVLTLFKRGIIKYSLGKHCTYCPVAGYCPAKIQQILNQYYYTITGRRQSIEGLSYTEIIKMVSTYRDLAPFIEILQNRIMEIPTEVLTEHNVTIKTRKTPLKYKDENGALQALLDKGADINEVAPRVLKSPPQLKSLSNEYYQATEPYLESQGEIKYVKFTKPLEK